MAKKVEKKDGYTIKHTTIGKSGFRWNIAKNSRWNGQTASDIQKYKENYNKINWHREEDQDG